MSTLIRFELSELRRLTNDKHSCVEERKITQHLALQPWCLGNIKEAVKNHIDYKIGKYDKEYDGILLSYKDLKILQNFGTIRNDNADIHFQIEAIFFIFRPHVGATLKGKVNIKSMTHLGILVHRVFNVVIPRPTDEMGSRWIGTQVVEGQEVTFKVVVLDLYGALPYIRGELDERAIIENNIDKMFGDNLDAPHIDFDKTRPQGSRNCGDGLIEIKAKPSSKSPEPASHDDILQTPDKKKLKRIKNQGRNSSLSEVNHSSSQSKKLKNRKT